MVTLQDLIVKNPWWESGAYAIEEVGWEKRNLYRDILANMDHSLVLNIIGLRRVGKSTILKQIIAHLLAKKVERRHVFYFLFDSSSRIQRAEFLEEVLSVYFRDGINRPNLSLEEPVYIFLDEIQYIENWQSVVKKFYDLSGKKIKFVITGSQSIFLKGKQYESLAGRIFDFYLPPLSFREFLAIRHAPVPVLDPFDIFTIPSRFGDLGVYDATNSGAVARLSREYITAGQFPETERLPDIKKKHEYIAESVLGKVLEDCVQIFKVEKANEFKIFAYQLINNASSIFELKNIGRDIGLSLITLEKYREYLEHGSLIEVLYRQHKSLLKRGRVLKKVYTPCTNFICALNHFTVEHIDEVPQAFGKIIENAIYTTLKEKYHDTKINTTISFWRHNDREIDFLVSEKTSQLPIEVKFSNTVTDTDAKEVAEYVKKHSIPFGVVVTKQELVRKKVYGQDIYYIPYYLLLLMV
jgi:hypothetical protein